MLFFFDGRFLFGLQQFPQNMRNWICFFSSDIKECKHLDAQMPPTSKVWLYMAPFADKLFWEWCLPHNFTASHQLIIQDQHPVEILYACSREKLWQNSEKNQFKKKNITVDIRDFDFAYITASCGVFLFQLPIICRVLQRQCQFLCSSMQIQGSIHLSWVTKPGLILLMVQKSGDHQLIWRIYHYLQGFINVRWCRISSINSMIIHDITKPSTILIMIKDSQILYPLSCVNIKC